MLSCIADLQFCCTMKDYINFLNTNTFLNKLFNNYNEDVV